MRLWSKPTKEEKRRWNKTYRDKNPKRRLLDAARTRAKQNGLEFNLELSDIQIPDVCPYLKTPFVKNTFYAMSLDRVNPTLGYIKGNIEVISRKANVMKNNASIQELLEFAYTILERH